MENDWKKKKIGKVGYQKVEYDKELMEGITKEGNFQITPHCDFDRTRVKENKSRKHIERQIILEGFNINLEHQS